MSLYFNILSCLVGCASGFCVRACFFSDKIRVVTDEDENQVTETHLRDRIRAANRYITYLEDLLNNSTDVTAQSVALNYIDASANLEFSNVEARVCDSPVSPSAPSAPSADIIQR